MGPEDGTPQKPSSSLPSSSQGTLIFCPLRLAWRLSKSTPILGPWWQSLHTEYCLSLGPPGFLPNPQPSQNSPVR
jgi:hypothetical protein